MINSEGVAGLDLDLDLDLVLVSFPFFGRIVREFPEEYLPFFSGLKGNEWLFFFVQRRKSTMHGSGLAQFNIMPGL